jgi:hypothetical protein
MSSALKLSPVENAIASVWLRGCLVAGILCPAEGDNGLCYDYVCVQPSRSLAPIHTRELCSHTLLRRVMLNGSHDSTVGSCLVFQPLLQTITAALRGPTRSSHLAVKCYCERYSYRTR